MWDSVGKGDAMHQQCPWFLRLPFPIRASNAQAGHSSACCSGTVPAHSSPTLSLALLPSGSLTAFCMQPVLQSGRCQQQPSWAGISCNCWVSSASLSSPCPVAIPQPYSTRAKQSTVPSVPQHADNNHKLKMQDAAPEQGHGCFSFPPWGWACALSTSLGIGCGTRSNHRLQSSNTPTALEPLSEEGRGPAVQWRR